MERNAGVRGARYVAPARQQLARRGIQVMVRGAIKVMLTSLALLALPGVLAAVESLRPLGP